MAYVVMMKNGDAWVDMRRCDTRDEAESFVEACVADDIEFAVQMGTEVYMGDYRIEEV